MVQSKKQSTSLEKDLNEMEINSLRDKDKQPAKVLGIKALTDLGGRMEGHGENFNKETEAQRCTDRR